MFKDIYIYGSCVDCECPWVVDGVWVSVHVQAGGDVQGYDRVQLNDGGVQVAHHADVRQYSPLYLTLDFYLPLNK